MGKVFVTKPTPEKENKFGRLFGFVCFDILHPANEAFTNLIIDEIKNNYYSSRNLKTFSKNDNSSPSFDLDSAAILEKSLKKTNKRISDFLENQNIAFHIEKIHAVVGVIKNTKLTFSISGNVDVLLLQHQSNGLYRIINITEDSKDNQDANPLSFFSQTLSGKISSLDYTFFISGNILDYMSLERIKNIITQDSIHDASSMMKKILKKIEKKSVFGGILTSQETLEDMTVEKNIETIKTFNYQKAASQDSMGELVSTERKTEKLLTSSTTFSFKKLVNILSSLITREKQNTRDTKKEKPRPQELNTSEPKKESTLKKRPTKLFSIKETTQEVKKYMNALKYAGRKAYGSKAVSDSVKAVRKKSFSFSKYFSRLSLKNKFILSGVFLFFVLFLFFTAKTFIGNEQNTTEKNLNEIVQEILQKKDAATAALIYNDGQSARVSLNQAQEIIDDLPEKYKNNSRISEINIEIEEMMEDLRNITSLPDPIMLANFGNLNPNIDPSPLLVQHNNILYTQGRDNGIFYTYDTDTRVISSISLTESEIPDFKLGQSWDENRILFIAENNDIYFFNSETSSLNEVTLNIPLNADIRSFDIFNKQLYILDSANNQIKKYTLSQEGFVKYTDWISDNTVDLTDAADMAIDGNIYLLKENGDLEVLSRGEKINTYKNVVDPPLLSPTKIDTQDTLNDIYILDPKSRRVVVLEKNGILIEQYSSPSFDNLLDIVALEDEKRIYILNNSAVMGVPLGQ